MPEMGESLRTMPPTCWPRLLGASMSWGGQLHQVAPARGLHPVPEGGELQHLVPEVGGVVGVELPGEEPQVLPGQPQGLAQVLDDALHRVGGDGPGEDGELRAEVAVHAADELVAEAAGEVQVDVGEQGHVLGDEALQGQAPPQGVDVADADEMAGQAAPPTSPGPCPGDAPPGASPGAPSPAPP